ncbi:MAG: Na+/H+ antiporter subunit G [Halothiobacillus sp.]|nr:Na+/H+ antiporter subunit G [Halothiobacillus sp.]
MLSEFTPWLVSGLISGLILLGSVFVLLGSVGMVKFPDFFMRLHAPTKASTLGVTAILVASMTFFTIKHQSPSLHELLIVVFLWLTAPISALMMASAGRRVHKKKGAQT